jgi:hypothetical protein
MVSSNCINPILGVQTDQQKKKKRKKKKREKCNPCRDFTRFLVLMIMQRNDR